MIRGGGAGALSCPHCAKRFISKSKMERHLVVHTKEKPYQCTACGVRFTQKPTLRTHQLKYCEKIANQKSQRQTIHTNVQTPMQ